MKFCTRLQTLLALAILPTPWVWGQAPDAAQIQRQIHDSNLKALPVLNLPPSHANTPSRAEPGDLTITVDRFVFQGQRLMETRELEQILAPFRDTPLNFSGLTQALQAVEAAYRAAGWMAAASLPPQAPSEGEVLIQIQEARLGQVQWTALPARTRREQLQAFLDRVQKPGQPLRGSAVDEALLLLDDWPGLSVRADYRAGQAAGETDLAVRVEDTGALEGNLSVDNMGARATGTLRRQAQLQVNRPLGIGDAIQTHWLQSEGSDYLRMAYQFPLGASGLRGGLRGSQLRYQLVGDFTSLQARGDAQSGGVEFRWPLVRSSLRNAQLSLEGDQRRYHNEANGRVSSEYRVHTTTFGWQGHAVDAWGGGGLNQASLAWVGGEVLLEGSPHAAADALGARTVGRFQKLTWQASRLQQLNASWSTYVSWNGQAANRNLDSSEKLFMGGASGVRAYPGSEGLANEGQLLALELRHRMTESLELGLFYDHGMGRRFHQPAYADGSGQLNNGSEPNRFQLRGQGLSVQWRLHPRLTLQMVSARRTSTNPLANAQGLDNDGSKVLNRHWLKLTMGI